MTDFRTFLTSLYDSVSEAETMALKNGQERLESLLEQGAIPEDVPLPVYHASDMEVTLNVRLEAEHGKEGVDVVMKSVEPDDPSAVTLSLDVFELIDRFDLDDSRSSDNGSSDKSERENQPVDVVQGIGPAHSLRLKQEGIETLSDLVELSPETLAELVSGERIDISPDRTAGWVEEAQGLRKILAEVEGEQPVELVDGIGPTFGRRLRDNDIAYLSELVTYSPEEISSIVSTEEMTISAQQAAGWLEQAELVLESMDSVDSRVSSASSLAEPRSTQTERYVSLRELDETETEEEQTKSSTTRESGETAPESEGNESTSTEEESDT